MAVTYLSYPRFVHDEFTQQFFGIPLELEEYAPDTRTLYLSAPKDSLSKKKLFAICQDSSLIQFALEDSNGISLDSYHFPDSNKLYFKLPASSLNIDSSRQIYTHFGEIMYEASLAELADIYSRKMMFNGSAIAGIPDKNNPDQVSWIGNHCATISLAGEPSLLRLSSRIIDSTASREAQAQQLLDFVSRNITYTRDAGELFRNTAEILLGKKADCSGKVVLFASLLEQIDYPYLLVYLPRHIALALPGDFSRKNGMLFEHEGQTYFFAETTFPGFLIGSTYFSPPLSENDIEFLQYPGKETKLYDVVNGDSLEFVKK